jgi:hypothetical protein
VIDSTSGLPRRPLISPAELAQERRGAAVLRDRLVAGDQPVRLIAVGIAAQDQQLVASAASSPTPVMSCAARSRCLRTELELMARDEPSGAELQAAPASAIEETGRLGRLADDLLLRSRAPAASAASCAGRPSHRRHSWAPTAA